MPKRAELPGADFDPLRSEVNYLGEPGFGWGGALRQSSFGRELTPARRTRQLALAAQVSSDEGPAQLLSVGSSSSSSDGGGGGGGGSTHGAVCLEISQVGHWPEALDGGNGGGGGQTAARGSVSAGGPGTGGLGATTPTAMATRPTTAAVSATASATTGSTTSSQLSLASSRNGNGSMFDFQRTATAASARSPRRRNDVQTALQTYVGAAVQAERSLRQLWASQQQRLPFWSDAAMPTSQLHNPAAAARVAGFRAGFAKPPSSPHCRLAEPSPRRYYKVRGYGSDRRQ